MKLYYYQCHNFGDALNTWLWPRLLPGILDQDDRSILVGIGTLLNERIPRQPFKVVFGSGVGYGKGIPHIDDKWKIYCVRGPLSARTLGLDPQLAITDPAVLLRTINLPSKPGSYRASFMPHWRSLEFWDWQSLCNEAGIHFINPTSSIESVLIDIQRSDLLIAEAMHGAIVADALRVPWVPVRIYKHILTFKWMDWCTSINVEYTPTHLSPLYSTESASALLDNRLQNSATGRWLQRISLRNHRLSQQIVNAIKRSVSRTRSTLSARTVPHVIRLLTTIAESTKPTLSSEHMISTATARLAEQLEQLKLDYKQQDFH